MDKPHISGFLTLGDSVASIQQWFFWVRTLPVLLAFLHIDNIQVRSIILNCVAMPYVLPSFATLGPIINWVTSDKASFDLDSPRSRLANFDLDFWYVTRFFVLFCFLFIYLFNRFQHFCPASGSILHLLRPRQFFLDCQYRYLSWRHTWRNSWRTLSNHSQGVYWDILLLCSDTFVFVSIAEHRFFNIGNEVLTSK